MIGVHTDLRGKIERNREPHLALAEQVAIALIGFRSAAETRVLAHGPEAAAVHRGVDTTGIWKFAWKAESFFRVPTAQRVSRIEPLNRPTGNGYEAKFALARSARLGLYVGHKENLFPERTEKPLGASPSLQRTSAAKRTDRKKSEEHGHHDRNPN